MSIEGTVTLDGKPLQKGDIQLSPLPGTASPTVGGAIANGKFNIPSALGPMVGKFRVQISSAGLTGRKILDPRRNIMMDEYGELLPAKYNSQSQLQAEVTSSGPNHFEFAMSQ